MNKTQKPVPQEEMDRLKEELAKNNIEPPLYRTKWTLDRQERINEITEELEKNLK